MRSERVLESRSGLKGVVDGEVPEFGRWRNLGLPCGRDREALADIEDMGLARIMFFALGVGFRPLMPFPWAEYYQHYGFPPDFPERYGDPESAMGRVNIILHEHRLERGFPKDFGVIVREVSTSNKVSGAWGAREDRVGEIAGEVFETMVQQMKAVAMPVYDNGKVTAWESPPIYYGVSAEVMAQELSIWQRALGQIATEVQEGNFGNVRSFLGLYHRVMDPITALPITDRQEEIFKKMYHQVRQLMGPLDLEDNQEQRLMVELARESSFRALVGERETIIRRAGHQELCYLDVDLLSLPRGEFAGSQRTVEIMEEMLEDAERYNQPALTPITVSYIREPGMDNPYLIILDGNNRGTALLGMRFFHEEGYRPGALTDINRIRAFVAAHHLDIEWEYDLVKAMQALAPRGDLVGRMERKREFVAEYGLALVPALLVQEANFMTISRQLSEGSGAIILLHPMHQAVYNSLREDVRLAIPAKYQTHGRALGNNVLFGLSLLSA